MPTATLEEYLESIYKLSEHGTVRPTQLAESMGVSGPTVTATLRRLESQGFVTRAGHGIELTAEGTSRSLDIVRRHRLAESFLVDVLGLKWEDAHEDACLLEHALSPRVLVALEKFLDNPAACPHGHPIPGADGSVRTVTGILLSDAVAGSVARVLRVREDDELLGYIGELGLKPGTEVKIVGVAPFDGPLTVEIAGVATAISREVGRRVTVEVIGG